MSRVLDSGGKMREKIVSRKWVDVKILDWNDVVDRLDGLYAG
jgi:hypothetical protein